MIPVCNTAESTCLSSSYPDGWCYANAASGTSAGCTKDGITEFLTSRRAPRHRRVTAVNRRATAGRPPLPPSPGRMASVHSFYQTSSWNTFGLSVSYASVVSSVGYTSSSNPIGYQSELAVDL